MEIRKITWEAIGKKENYDCYVWVDDENKLILKMKCMCWNFSNRRLKSFGENAYKKTYSYPCKHLKKITDRLTQQGYKLKIPSMQGTNKCTIELRKKLIDRSGGICERSYCEKPGVVVHRKIPGHAGGKYNEENCVIICKECHKEIHKGEFKHIS